MQERYGSRKAYSRAEQSGDQFLLSGQEIGFIQSRDGFYMSTVGANGWPYVQFRGGVPGFLRVMDARTLAFADYRGNRQYISMGNIQDNGKVALILLDYARQQRLKIWAEATIHYAEDVPDWVEKVHVKGYDAKVERVIKLNIRAYDWNCQQHITPRYTLEQIKNSPQLLALLGQS
jgi:predicted pyridoxine 5'-phosphate oxidase superfamily flavin-nucleotide-binding protein